VRDALGRFQTILVLGGGSDIAHATLRELLVDGPSTVILAARHPDALVVDELEALGATVEREQFDARAIATHLQLLNEIFDRHGDIDLVLVAFGELGSQDELEQDAAAVAALLETNFVGGASALTVVVNRLRRQGHGSIVVLSSVAGQRARRSNYIYGSAKAGLDAFAQGVQLALRGSGVSLLIVRPGFVHTKMTAGLAAAPLSVESRVVARAIVAGLRQGKSIVWVPPAMRAVAWLLRLLPASALERM
jgi:decaprenylphospho-beta-D-erythro-pentofuranosid-2-ulose 2-reductase